MIVLDDSTHEALKSTMSLSTCDAEIETRNETDA